MNINSILQHELSIQRVATGLINKGLYPSIDEAVKAVRLILLDAETIKSPTKLNQVTKAIKKAVEESMTPAWDEYSASLLEVAVVDATFFAAASELPKVPGSKTIQEFIDTALMSLSGPTPKVGTWAEFVAENISGMTTQINNLVKAGYVNSATVNQIVSTARQFGEGLSKQQADSLARTGLQHYAQSARRAMADDNADIIGREYPLVTFDNRTSQKCISINVRYPDGWEHNKSPVGYPPYHFRCRTSVIYGLKGQGDPRKDVTQAGVGSGENYESGDKYKGKRNVENQQFKIDQIPADMPFGTWLKKQDVPFVEDVLGVKKAKLFLDGGLPIERMSDATGRELTLKELRSRYGEYFVKAGI